MLNLLIGGFLLTIGLVSLIGRFVAPDSMLFSKLQPMKEQYGDGPGLALHVFSYTVMPLVLGLSFLRGPLLGL